MEEERARQKKELDAAGDGGAPADAAAPAAAPAPPAADEDDADAELRAAMAMSMASMAEPAADDAAMDTSADDTAMLSEEEQIARALAMSMGSEEPAMDTTADDAAPAAAEDVSKMLQDPSFLTSVLSELPNVDPNDAEIRDAVANLASGMETEKKDSEGDKKDESSA